MTREEAIQWIQLDIEMAKFDPTTGEDAYLNNDAKNVIEAQEMAISALKIQDKLLNILKGFGSDLPCDESPDDDWCAEHCQYIEPQKECWIRWAKGVMGLPLEDDKE